MSINPRTRRSSRSNPHPPIEYDLCVIGINDDVLEFLRVKAEHGWVAWFMEIEGMQRAIYFYRPLRKKGK